AALRSTPRTTLFPYTTLFRSRNPDILNLESCLTEHMLTTPADIPRPSGRLVNQLRPLTIEVGYTRHAEGSVLIKAGDTHVLCNEIGRASCRERVEHTGE